MFWLQTRSRNHEISFQDLPDSRCSCRMSRLVSGRELQSRHRRCSPSANESRILGSGCSGHGSGIRQLHFRRETLEHEQQPAFPCTVREIPQCPRGNIGSRPAVRKHHQPDFDPSRARKGQFGQCGCRMEAPPQSFGIQKRRQSLQFNGRRGL